MYRGMKMDGKKLYKIIIETPKIKGAGATGEFFMKIKGSSGMSEEFIISSFGFKDGATDIFSRRLKDLGELEKIYVRNIGFYNYICKRFTIE